MVFKVGDSVKTSDGEYGRVTRVAADSITYITPWRETKTAKAGDLQSASGFMGFMANETPDIVEVLANTASFALINRVTGKVLIGTHCSF